MLRAKRLPENAVVLQTMTSSNTPPLLAKMKAFRLGDLLVEPAFRRLTHQDGRAQVIEPKMMMVLVVLAEAQGNVIAREEIIHKCWEGRAVSDDAIHRIISRLRAVSVAIGSGCFQLETLNKVGYRLIAASPTTGLEEAESRVAIPEVQLVAVQPVDAQPNEKVLPRFDRRRLLATCGASVLALAIGGSYVAFRRSLRNAPDSSSLVMIVLPFVALSKEAVAPLLARSVTESMRDELGRMSGVRVIAATSSQAIAQQQLSASQIRERMGADLLVEGSTAIADTTARVSLTMTDTHTEQQIWSTSVSGSSDDLMQLQNDLAAQLIQQIAVRIHAGATNVVGPIYHRDPEVYRLTLQAQEQLEKVRSLRMSDQASAAFDAADEADRLARQALAIDGNDPESLLVLAQLTRNGWTRTLSAQSLTTMQRATESLEYIRRALYSDAANPAALVSLGDYYRRFEWRWDDAEALFKRALAINPSLVEAHWSYGYELGTLGNALAGLDHALTLYELDPGNPWHRVALPRLLFVSGQYEAAMKRYDAEVLASPANVFLLYEIYFTHLTMSNIAALQNYAERLLGIWQGKTMPSGVLALLKRISLAVDALKGQPQAFVAQLDADLNAFNTGGAAAATLHGRSRDDLPFIFAIEYAWAGRFPQAIAMLDQALSARSVYWPACLPYGPTPFPQEMRRDSRFQALWSRDPHLADAIDRRRAAVENRLMAGTLDDGRSTAPRLSASLLSRIQSSVGGTRAG